MPNINPKSWDLGEKAQWTEGGVHDVLYLNSFYKAKEHDLLMEETIKK